jgi:hypothetical protein
MFKRATTKQLSSGNPSRENNNGPQQPHSRNTKKLQKGSSFKGFFLLSIAVTVYLMIVSTHFANKEHRNTTTAATTDGRPGPLVLLDGSAGDDRKIQLHRLLPLSTNEYSSLPSKKNENNRNANSTSVEDKLKPSIISTLERFSSPNLEIANGVLPSNSFVTTSSTSIVPYYLKGKTQYKRRKFHRKDTFQKIKDEEAKPINPSQKVWVLPDPIKLPTRNHESILLEYETTSENNDGEGDQGGVDKQILVNILGRYSRGVQWLDLKTGEQRSMETNGTDPDQRPLNDLNHVASVLVDSLEVDGNGRTRKEVWLPCGFHNDPVGKELSSNYVRIVDLETMEVRTGPKLPYSGGACGAVPIEAILGEPPLVCALGGTNGNHDTGESVRYFRFCVCVFMYERKLFKKRRGTVCPYGSGFPDYLLSWQKPHH